MCGIIAYSGYRKALPILIEGLRRLEYRGYDSAGVALCDGEKVFVTRAEGKLSNLVELLEEKDGGEDATIGIGHTRWATHGRPSSTNAHPHTAGRVSLIHNGIVENYAELKESLKKQGVKFNSDTDTEIIAHLLNIHLSNSEDKIEALRQVCAEIEGSYAFVAFDAQDPSRLMIAKNSSPVIIGKKEREVFVASDVSALLEHTRDVIAVHDGDIAVVSPERIYIENNGKEVIRQSHHITWDPVTAQKGGYKHFMLKEIFEQPEVIGDTIRGRLDRKANAIDISEMRLTKEDLEPIKRVILIACGTAWHACLVGKFYIESFAGLPCEVDYASEFRYRDPILDSSTLVVAVTQSGETLDTLSAITLASKSCMTAAICNVIGSSITRATDRVLFTRAGPEISVASTKAFTTQLVSLYMLGLYIGQTKGRIDKETANTLIKELTKLPAVAEESLKCEEKIKSLAQRFHLAKDFLYLGRGLCYPIALEGALKLKEISYIHAEGYPAGEMKHGPIALIDENMPVVVVLQKSDIYFDKTLSNLKEVEARGGKILSVTDTTGHGELAKISHCVVEIPYISQWLSPITLSLPLQLLAYYIAVENGTDVDQPRNLAKSVTVE
ncbi:MAG: glutamine--fructose-6-phosphate transaminase (isomerizing) [Candidatus Dadabacteria bacterium]|nr:MAG: glutamine--fructose-6-phosphate transaminase (isomerizing) [Candidatus Dadabacteria bacterium]